MNTQFSLDVGRYPLHVRVVPRTFRFKFAARTSRGVYHERHVWYVVITSPANLLLFGIGECAPLYDLSADFTPDYEERLRAVCQEVERNRCIDVERLRHVPSILFGLQTAWRSAQGSLLGDWRLLYTSPFTRGESDICINGLVWMGDIGEMLARMEKKLAAGFRCVKLKIGALKFDDELALIHRLRARFSRADVEIRVDANGSFSIKEVFERLEALARYDIHSIEQPIRAGQWASMGRICRTSPIPIALDEELIGVDDTEGKVALLEEIRPQYLVLKPSLHGGLMGAEEWMHLAARRDIPYWVTSALESNVGLNAIAQWTEAVAERIWREERRDKQNSIRLPGIYGLGTGQLLTTNFEKIPLRLDGERLHYTDGARSSFLENLQHFYDEWTDVTHQTMIVHTSGSTGKPKQMQVEKRHMMASAEMTCRFLGLTKDDVALLCMPLRYIAGKMMAVRAFVIGMRLVSVTPSAHPFSKLAFAPTFVAMTPHQVCRTLEVPREAALLRSVKVLIIGGGAVNAHLAAILRSFPGAVWSTYGMTETLSHVALRRLSGTSASDFYMPLPGVDISLSGDGCLVVSSPAIGVDRLRTNDLADIRPDGSFRILGRRDNVVCSGGLKLQLEDLEQRLVALTVPFVLTAVPDVVYGEALTMLYEGNAADVATLRRVREFCASNLSRWEIPKHFFAVGALPYTETNKPDRATARTLARKLAEKNK